MSLNFESRKMELSKVIFLPIQTGFQVRMNVQTGAYGNYGLIQVKDASSSLCYQISSGGLDRVWIPESRQKLMKKYLVQKDDVLYLSRLNLGAFRYNLDSHGDVVPMSHFYILRPRCDVVHPDYLCWVLNQDFIKPDIFRNLKGSVLPFISKDALKKLRIPVPDVDFQKKIVALLNLRRQEKEKQKKMDKKKDILINEVMTRLL